ncbi:hypothetical protein IW261DRAFT_1439110 [Armillaria novae-zelandiae]|uniref:F-box domain-containing protein n=1 Tax=Armillaria novae-zelandiae TaxID=153914 RepID=A0AA39UI25_9AGAR|nr:hypothetical protein IW261DRAFT_1439110 [Armillaria novae-zelandiae]
MITAASPTCRGPCSQCGSALSERPLPNGISVTRYQHFFVCNEAPVGEERAELEAVVREGERYLALLQQRISLTQNTLESLLKEQNRVAKHVSDSKLVLNPVRRLPPEILSHIFLSCLLPDTELLQTSDTDADISLIDSLNMKISPWNLSYVSSQWRKAVLTTPRLWSYIRLQLCNYEDRKTSLFRLGTILERSGTHYLSIAIESEEDMSDHPVLPMILSTSPRWERLFVGLPLSTLCIFNNVSGSLDALRWLGVCLYEPEPDTNPITMIEAFRFAPQLQELQLMEWDWAICFQDLFHFPWDHLIHAEVHGNNMQALAVVQRASNLVSGSFSADIDFLSDTPSDLCWHAHLQVLTVTNSSDSVSECIFELFSRLALPGLLDLRMDFSSTGDDILLPAFTSETAPMLQDLHIHVDDSKTLESEMLTSLLICTPLLVSLKLSATVATDDVFLQLGRKREFSRLVPQLRSIDLTGSTFEFEGEDVVISEMVASRREAENGSRTFQTLILDEPLDFADDDFFARWEGLCRDGLDVQYGE